jgi:hypothetical protein
MAGDVSDWSFMYEVPSGGSETVKGRRLLKEIFPVYECSNVLIGMNPLTRTTAKSIGVDSLRIDRIQEAVLAKIASIFPR